MRQLIVEQWSLTDPALGRAYQEQHRGTWVTADGYDELRVVGRFGVIQLPRHVCYNSKADCHGLPGNTALPLHRVTSRGLQEGVGLLPQDVPVASAQRLLGWLMREKEAVEHALAQPEPVGGACRCFGQRLGARAASVPRGDRDRTPVTAASRSDKGLD
jgi:hypothetical protein